MKFLTVGGVMAYHAMLIADFGGGSSAVRDPDGLASAVARPRNYLAYKDPKASLTTLAALYGHGIARNHTFIDGNKRTAWIAMYSFLGLNGLELKASDAEVIAVMVQVADGRLTVEHLAAWLSDHIATSL
jgi:death-on-curing protein